MIRPLESLYPTQNFLIRQVYFTTICSKTLLCKPKIKERLVEYVHLLPNCLNHLLKAFNDLCLKCRSEVEDFKMCVLSAGMYSPSGGEARIDGHSISSELNVARQSLGLCPQHNMLFSDLTVYEHFMIFAMVGFIYGLLYICLKYSYHWKYLTSNSTLMYLFRH